MKKEKGKSMVPASIGIAAVWFGTHVGPGTASGKQVTTFFSTYGKLGVFLPIIAMGILGLAIYYALEFARKNSLHDFRSFTDKFFYPHNKLFSLFFEATFLITSLLAPGACIATAAGLLYMHLGVNIWIGTILVVGTALVLTIYGAELVKSASTALTIGIMVALGIIAFLGIKAGAPNFNVQWKESSVSDVSLWAAIWSAVTYAGFQATGNLGNAISVSQGLNSKKDSFKAASLGTILNSVLLILIILTVYGYQPDALVSDLPNYFVVQQLGKPALGILYVALVIFASLSTIIGFCSGVIARYGKFVKIHDEKKRNLSLISVLLILDVIVSTFGLAAIVNVGFRYLGYLSIPLVLLPFLIVGFKKEREDKVKEDIS